MIGSRTCRSLAGDARLGLDRAALAAMLEAGRREAGAAREQTAAFAAAVRALEQAHPATAAYAPGAIL